MKKIIISGSLMMIVLFTLQRSNAQPCFDPKTSYTAGINSSSLCYADFNGDIAVDLAVANISSGGSNVSVLLGDGTGSFGVATYLEVGLLPSSICSADFNGDGNADLATTNRGPGTASILLGDGTGAFNPAAGFSTGVFNQSSICSADFNGDGNADLVITSGFNFVLLSLGDGTGSFGAPSHVTADNGTGSVTAADFNGDGNMDLAITTYNGSSHVSVILGNGAGSFGTFANFSVDNSPVSLVSGDFNSDGLTDLATANTVNNVTGSVSILIGDGAGGFATAATFGVGANTVPKGICPADFDGDGKTDLAAACIANNSMPNVSILPGDGAGGFGSPVSFATDSFPNSVISSDFNADGKMDLALATTKTNIDSSKVSVLLNCLASGLSELTGNEEEFIVYPNPVASNVKINILGSGIIDEIKIADISGRTVIQLRKHERNTSFHLENSGIYFLTVVSGTHISTRILIVGE